MLDLDTFLTVLYVTVDDFCKAHLAPEVRPGPKASLTRSEVVTLALLGQWGRFTWERDFRRFAQARLRGAFPRLPDRSQFNPPQAGCTTMPSSLSVFALPRSKRTIRCWTLFP